MTPTNLVDIVFCQSKLAEQCSTSSEPIAMSCLCRHQLLSRSYSLIIQMTVMYADIHTLKVKDLSLAIFHILFFTHNQINNLQKEKSKDN